MKPNIWQKLGNIGLTTILTGKEASTMEKEKYTPVEIEVIAFDVEDVITHVSNYDGAETD